jgi:septal ring factor EnvC (AmiA/AmiB activator)
VELTTSSAVAAPVEAAAGRDADAQEARKQDMWQERYQAARSELEFLEQEVHRLEGEVGRLETEFYSTDDPARRDGVVKPAWDQALADLQATRERLSAARSAPEEVRDEALRDGALPGWFRGLPPPGDQQETQNAGGG